MTGRARTGTKISTALAGAVCALALTSAAQAAPSGGGGAAPSMPMQGPQIDPAQSYSEGLAALEAGDFKEAEEKFGEVLSVAPKNPEANYFMGVAKQGRGRDKQSVRYFERAIKAREDFTEARERLALVQIKLGKPEEAEEQVVAMKAQQTACQSGGDCGPAYVDRLAAAIAKVEAALAAPPAAEGESGETEEDEDVSAAPTAERHASLFLLSGEAAAGRYRDAVRLINESRFEEAVDDLYRAQAAIGPHPDILNYLGFAHRKLGRMDEAQRYYAQALAINPDHLGANEYLGELYLEIGEVEKARGQLAKLDALCAFGCAEREDLARLIDIKESLRSAAR